MNSYQLVDLINTIQDHINDLEIESKLILERNNSFEFERFKIVTGKIKLLNARRDGNIKTLKGLG